MLRLLASAPQPWGCSPGGHREAEARNPVAVRVTDRWPPVGKGAAARGTWPVKEKMSVGSINQCAEPQNHRRGKGHL